MPLLQLESVDLHFGEQIIFDHAELLIEKGDKVGLIGRNGEGKSTLLKVIAGRQEVDSGHVFRQPQLRIAEVEQILPPASNTLVHDYVADGAASLLADLNEYEALSTKTDERSLNQMHAIQQRIEAVDGWNFHHRLARVLENFDLDRGQALSDLSGGWRRKAAIARALVSEPDILLLDEPTNHLDIGLIKWLEQFINNYNGAMVLITHDRAFLRAVSNQIAELDRGLLTVWKGDYDSFLVHKAEQLAAEAKQNALFDKRLADEETWIRQGIKARRTRNEGRVRALKKMRDERSQRRTKKSLGDIEISKSVASGKLVADIQAISFGYEGNSVVRDFTSTIIRGDKIGLIGPNGVGKSTFLKLVLGELEPQAGTIKRGTQLDVAYFDQMRDQIDMEANVVDNVGEGRQSVEVNGKDKHILSYLQDFMFSPARARTPMKALSGGECSRVLLAKLFCKSTNLLVMDEPTNDLDTDTLELLESLLVDYPGTVLLVSHDREFLDNVVSSSIVFEGNGSLQEYVGGYQDWLRQGGDWDRITTANTSTENTGSGSGAAGSDANEQAAEQSNSIQNKSVEVGAVSPSKPAKKLSYKLKRELEQLPKKIEQLEETVEALNEQISDASFYSGERSVVDKALSDLAGNQQALEKAYERWDELESEAAE